MKELVLYVLGEVNYLAVFLAAVANFLVGALWYSPLLFIKPWMKELYNTTDPKEIKPKHSMAYTMGMAFVSTLLMAYALSIPIVIMESMQFDMKLILVFTAFIGIGFMVMNLYKHSLFEGKSFKLVLINGGHDLVVMLLMAIIIVSMQDPDADKLKEVLMQIANK